MIKGFLILLSSEFALSQGSSSTSHSNICGGLIKKRNWPVRVTFCVVNIKLNNNFIPVCNTITFVFHRLLKRYSCVPFYSGPQEARPLTSRKFQCVETGHTYHQEATFTLTLVTYYSRVLLNSLVYLIRFFTVVEKEKVREEVWLIEKQNNDRKKKLLHNVIDWYSKYNKAER